MRRRKKGDWGHTKAHPTGAEAPAHPPLAAGGEREGAPCTLRSVPFFGACGFLFACTELFLRACEVAGCSCPKASFLFLACGRPAWLSAVRFLPPASGPRAVFRPEAGRLQSAHREIRRRFRCPRWSRPSLPRSSHRLPPQAACLL